MKYVLQGTETERLKFELLTEDLFDEWISLFEVKDIALFLGMDNTLSSKELCELWFEKVFSRYKNDLGGMNVLIDKTTQEFIGQCGLLVQTVEGKERLEIGYSILPQFWNKGYASEASAKCKEIAFERNYTDSLISIVHVKNTASASVAIKNGMTKEKYLADYKGMPVNIYSIKKS